MGKAQVSYTSAADQGNGPSSILKIKNCNNCGAEYARKGTLCGSCRGIRHRLLKKERERKNCTSPPSPPSLPSPPSPSSITSSPSFGSLVTSGGFVSASPSPSPVSPLAVRSSSTPNLLASLTATLAAEDAYVELPPIHIPIPARTKESQRDLLVSSITSCTRCDSHLECQRCFSLDREVRRLNQERLDLQKQLSDMEIEVHAMRLQLMNEMRVSVVPGLNPARQLQQTPSFLFGPTVSSSYPDQQRHHHSGVSVCQLVN